MNKHIIGAVIAVLVCAYSAPAVMAQMGGFTPPTPEERVQQLEEAINLTGDQREQILDIYSDTSGGRGMRGMFGGQLPEAVQDVLTEEQIAAYNDYVLKQQVDMRLGFIEQAVSNLSDEQKAQIVPVLEKEINTRNDLLASMRGQGQGGDFQNMMDDMQAINDATTEALGSILTDDQMAQYREMPQGFGGRGMRGPGGRDGGMRGQ